MQHHQYNITLAFFQSSEWLTAVPAAIFVDGERSIASVAVVTSQHNFLALAKIGAAYLIAVTWVFANRLTDVYI